MVGNSPALPCMVIGQPHWSWNTIPGHGNTVNYNGQRSELVYHSGHQIYMNNFPSIVFQWE